MSNPARMLFVQFAEWNKGTGNPQAGRKMNSNPDEATEKHIVAMKLLWEVERTLSVMKADGRNVDSYIRMIRPWAYAILNYPYAWQGQSNSNAGLFTAHVMDSLEHLADALDGWLPQVDPQSIGSLRGYLDVVQETLNADTTLPDPLRRYMSRLISETRLALDNHEVDGDFSIREAMDRLWVALNACAEKSKGAKTRWRNLVRGFDVPTMIGLSLNATGVALAIAASAS